MSLPLQNLFDQRARRPPHFVQVTNQDGKFLIEGLSSWYQYWRDPYHLMLTIPWAAFVVLMALGYVVINLIFTLLYLLGGDCLQGARPGSFEDAFFFSVQTLGTIGYGVISPKTTYANLVVTLETITALLIFAIVTGISFTRFARATARVIFSRWAVVTVLNGVPTLEFRTANRRRNQILEAQVRAYLMRDEVTAEGEFFRRIYDLKLVRHRSPSFSLTWTIMHPIDENSPLYATSPELLAKTQTQIVVSLSGLDETVSDMIHARYIYGAQEILWNHRLVDIVHKAPTGDRYIDYTHFHHVVPLEPAVAASNLEVD